MHEAADAFCLLWLTRLSDVTGRRVASATRMGRLSQKGLLRATVPQFWSANLGELADALAAS